MNDDSIIVGSQSEASENSFSFLPSMYTIYKNKGVNRDGKPTYGVNLQSEYKSIALECATEEDMEALASLLVGYTTNVSMR